MALTIHGASDNSVTTTANTTHYFPFSGCIGQAFTTTEADVAVTLRDTGTFKNLSILVTANGISGGASTIRCRKNSANGNLSISVGASATGDFQDTSNSDTIADSDTYNMQFVPGASTGTMNIVCASVAFEATSSSDSVCKLIAAQSTNYTTASSTRFGTLNGVMPLNGQTTESVSQAEIRKSASLRNLACRISSNARTTTTTVSVRKNGSNSTLSMSVGSGATGTFQDTDSVSVVAGDDVNYSIQTGTGNQTLTMKHLAVTHYTGSSAGIGMTMCGNTSVRTTNANVTVYLAMGGSLQATSSSGEDSIDTNVLHDFTASDLTTRVTANTVSAATTMRLRKNASNTAVVVSVTASTSGIFTDSSNTENIVSGDNLAIQVAAGATGTSISYSAIWWYSTIAGTNYSRSPTAEDVTVSDSSTTRILTANRAPSSDSTTVSDSSLTRMLSASRSPSSDSVTTSEDLQRSKTWPRQPSDETVDVSDVSVVRMYSALRVPDSESVTTGEDLTRMTHAFRTPSSDSITVAEELTGGKLLERAPSTDSITVADSSLTRLLSALRLPTTDDVTTGENLTRMLSAMRSPSSDSVTIQDVSTTQSLTRGRTTEESVTVADSSLTRLLSATRSPSTDSITVVDSSLTRMYSALRVPSTETVDIVEDIDSLVTNPGQFNRSPATETVTVGENLTRVLQLFRVPSSDSVTVNENVSGGKLLERVVAADTVNVVEQSLTRIKSANRSVEDTSNVNEASLTRLLSALRIPSSDTVTVAELQNAISHSRSLQETISVTEPILQRIVTSIRNVGPDTVDIAEEVFFQTYHKFLFDSVPVAEQLFSIRDQLGGSMSYATPNEVRPLLGNIGAQRTDAQIQLAIDSAYDEINRKTNRIPPNDWKDTEADFSIIKKIARYKAALEMSIGIKDFEDREAMQKEVEEMFMIIEQNDPGGVLSNDMVISSDDATYALNPAGTIWSTRYPNLKKNPNPGDENSTTINPDT